MNKLVTVSREYGSGGRLIGACVAKKLGVPMYDKEIIDMAAIESGLSKEIIESAELRAQSSFSYLLSSALSFGESFGVDTLSMNEKLFLTQYDIISDIGKRGEGVIVGRCADFVLKDVEGVTNVFIHASLEARIKRVIEQYGAKPGEAEKLIAKYDKARRNYYNYHTSLKWGEYSNYDLSINTDNLSDEDAADLIIEFMRMTSK